MRLIVEKRLWSQSIPLAIVCAIFLAAFQVKAQDVAASGLEAQTAVSANTANAGDSEFRVESIPVAGGAELITIFAKQSNFGKNEGSESTEMPLLSVLRDTLGDDRPENDRLRFVWLLSYTKPTFWQKAASVVPLLYTRTVNKDKIGTAPPPPLADMQRSNKDMWNKVLWFAFKRILIDQLGYGLRASTLQYRQNRMDYRRTAVASALTVLMLYQKVEGEKLLSDTELKDIQSKLWLSDSITGGMMQDENLGRAYEKKAAEVVDNRGHNWELLRQYTEAQGLYFEPLEMPGGESTHAMVWASAEDIAAKQGSKFDGRFLNIKNPWQDPSLLKWKGYKQVQWVDEEGRTVAADTPGAKQRTLIPLAVYGLDTQKIPAILIDFRNDKNAKRREMSRRVLNDVTRNLIATTYFSSIPFLLGRFIYDFATGRRGTDLNQAPRIRSYAQLKMLLSLNADLDGGLRDELANRIEDVSLNPMENDVQAEAKIARAQYRNLVDYARRPDGLPAQLDRDRRAEMSRYANSSKKQTFYDLGHALSLGLYTHRETSTPEMVAKMDMNRQLQYHERILNEMAYRSAKPEIDSDVEQLKRSLEFLSQVALPAKDKTAHSLAKIFAMTDDEDTRRLCLVALYKIDSKAAKSQLLAIYKDPKVEIHLRDLSAQFLKQSVAEGKRISHRTAATVAEIAAN